MNRLTYKSAMGDYGATKEYESPFAEICALRNALGKYEDEAERKERMTINKLESIIHLEKEIEQYEQRIQEIDEMATSTTANLSGMPSGGSISDKVGNGATELAHYRELLIDAARRRIANEIEIVEYMQTVDNAEMRLKLWLRFIRCMTWQEVADVIGGGNTEDSVRKSVTRFIEL